MMQLLSTPIVDSTRDRPYWLITTKEEIFAGDEDATTHPFLINEAEHPYRYALRGRFTPGTLENDTPFWVCDTEDKCNMVLANLIPGTYEVHHFENLIDLLSFDTEIYNGATDLIIGHLTAEDHGRIQTQLEYDDETRKIFNDWLEQSQT